MGTRGYVILHIHVHIDVHVYVCHLTLNAITVGVSFCITGRSFNYHYGSYIHLMLNSAVQRSEIRLISCSVQRAQVPESQLAMYLVTIHVTSPSYCMCTVVCLKI